MLISVPTITWTLSYHVRHMQPSLGWADVHDNFGLVFEIGTVEMQSVRDAYYASMVSFWLPLVASFVYFLCFGMHDGVLSHTISAYHGGAYLFSKLRR
jgi:hypothetical protein